MDIPPLLLQSGISLLAILALFLLARALKLGGEPPLANEAEVKSAAQESQDGFDAARISISRDGKAALALNPEGRIMLIKAHGNRTAGRILGPGARVSEKVDMIEIDCGERRFGPVTLRIDDAPYWVDAINRL